MVCSYPGKGDILYKTYFSAMQFIGSKLLHVGRTLDMYTLAFGSVELVRDGLPSLLCQWQGKAP